MFKPHGLYFKGKFFIVYKPLVGDFFKIRPLAAARFTARIFCAKPGIAFQVERSRPYNLRVGTKQNHVAPTFEFIAVSRGNHAVIAPFIASSHIRHQPIFSTESETLSPPSSKSFSYPPALGASSHISDARTAFASSAELSLSTLSDLPSAW